MRVVTNNEQASLIGMGVHPPIIIRIAEAQNVAGTQSHVL